MMVRNKAMNSLQIYSPVQLANYLGSRCASRTTGLSDAASGSAFSALRCPILKITPDKTTLTTLFKILSRWGW